MKFFLNDLSVPDQVFCKTLTLNEFVHWWFIHIDSNRSWTIRLQSNCPRNTQSYSSIVNDSLVFDQVIHIWWNHPEKRKRREFYWIVLEWFTHNRIVREHLVFDQIASVLFTHIHIGSIKSYESEFIHAWSNHSPTISEFLRIWSDRIVCETLYTNSINRSWTTHFQLDCPQITRS